MSCSLGSPGLGAGMTRGCSCPLPALAGSQAETPGMQTAVRWMQQAAKPVAGSEQRGRASGSGLPATRTAAPLRLLEKGPHRSCLWKNSELEAAFPWQLQCSVVQPRRAQPSPAPGPLPPRLRLCSIPSCQHLLEHAASHDAVCGSSSTWSIPLPSPPFPDTAFPPALLSHGSGTRHGADRGTAGIVSLLL